MEDLILEALNTVYSLPGWLSAYFDERQLKQIQFSMIYKTRFNHGTDGHNNMVIINKLAELVMAEHSRFEMAVEDYRKLQSELKLWQNWYGKLFDKLEALGQTDGLERHDK